MKRKSQLWPQETTLMSRPAARKAQDLNSWFLKAAIIALHQCVALDIEGAGYPLAIWIRFSKLQVFVT